LNPEKPLYGGRALPNGVMMVGPTRMAVSVRQADGSIATESTDFSPPFSAWRKTPFVRGPVAIAGAAVLALKSMALQRGMTTSSGARRRQAMQTLAPVLAISIMERVVRVVLTIRKRDEKQRKPGLVSVFMPLLAFRLLGLTGPGRQLLKYHAAEHMAVNAAEAGRALNAGEAEDQSRIHPRCGTSFAVWAMFLTWVSRGWVKSPLRAAIAGVATVSVAFELLHFGARNRDSSWVKAVFGPTWQAQRLTTMPPEREHLEVAVAALIAVMPADVPVETTVTDIV